MMGSLLLEGWHDWVRGVFFVILMFFQDCLQEEGFGRDGAGPRVCVSSTSVSLFFVPLLSPKL